MQPPPGHQLGIFALHFSNTDVFRQELHMPNTSCAVGLICIIFRNKLFSLPAS